MTWILPTLSRPKQCAAVLDRMREKGLSSKVLIFINGDGFGYEDFKNDDLVTIHRHNRNAGALGALNEILAGFPNESWYGFIGDDEFVNTPGFDQKIIAAAGDWNIAHGDDGIHRGQRTQGYLCIGGKLARAVGFLALPECWHHFGLDDLWETLAKHGGCSRNFLYDVKVEHRHPYFGTAERDECYTLGESLKEIDYQVFAHWVRHHLQETLDRIAAKKERAP